MPNLDNLMKTETVSNEELVGFGRNSNIIDADYCNCCNYDADDCDCSS